MNKLKLFYKNKKLLFILLIIILIIVLYFIFYILFPNKKNSINNNNNDINNIKENLSGGSNGEVIKDEYGNYFSKTEFGILELDELYVLFKVSNNLKPYRSISDLSLYDAYVVMFNRFESVSDETKQSGDSKSLIISGTDVNDMYNNGICFSNLFKFKYKDFDNYKYDVSKNVFIKDKTLQSKRDNEYAKVVARKVINYSFVDGYYNIDVKYLFANNKNMFDKGKNAYGSLNDISNESNKIIRLSSKIDAQKYLNDNFDKIKNNLDTYHYKIEVKPTGRIYLIDFKVD